MQSFQAPPISNSITARNNVASEVHMGYQMDCCRQILNAAQGFAAAAALTFDAMKSAASPASPP